MKNAIVSLLFLVLAAPAVFSQRDQVIDDKYAASNPDELKKIVKDINAAIQADPSNSFNYFARGSLKSKLKDLPGALADYDKALELKKDYPEAFVNRGVLRGDLGNAAGAMSDFEAAIRYNRRMPEAYYNKGYTLYTGGKPAESIAYYDTALALNPDYRSAYSNKMEALTDLQRYPEAEACFALLQAHFPGHPLNYMHKANLDKAKGQLISALRDYDQAILLSKQDSGMVLERAMFKDDMLGDHKGAAADCNQVISLNPGIGKAWYVRARAEYSMEQYDKVVEDCSTAISLVPQYYDAYVFRGNAYDFLNEKMLAIKDYDMAMGLNSKAAQPYIEKSGTLMSLGDTTGALKVLETCAGSGVPPNKIILLRLLELQVVLHRYQEADTWFARLSSLHMQDGESYYWAGVARDSLHDRKGACALLVKAWRDGMDTVFSYVRDRCRGSVPQALLDAYDEIEKAKECDARGNPYAAITHFDKVIRLLPDSAAGYYNRGKVKRKLGNHEEAIKDYLEAIRRAPGFTDAYISAAVSYSYLNDLTKAREYYAAALKTDPVNAMCYNNLGIMAKAASNYKDAIGLLKKAVDCKYNYLTAWSNLAECYKLTGDVENACFAYHQALALGDIYAKVEIMNLCK